MEFRKSASDEVIRQIHGAIQDHGAQIEGKHRVGSKKVSQLKIGNRIKAGLSKAASSIRSLYHNKIVPRFERIAARRHTRGKGERDIGAIVGKIGEQDYRHIFDQVKGGLVEVKIPDRRMDPLLYKKFGGHDNVEELIEKPSGLDGKLGGPQGFDLAALEELVDERKAADGLGEKRLNLIEDLLRGKSESPQFAAQFFEDVFGPATGTETIDMETHGVRHLMSMRIEGKEEGTRESTPVLKLFTEILSGYMKDPLISSKERAALGEARNRLENGMEIAAVLDKRWSSGPKPWKFVLPDRMLRSLASKLIGHIDQKPAIFELGYRGHAVGFDVERGDDGKVHVRMSNMGGGSGGYPSGWVQDSDGNMVKVCLSSMDFVCDTDEAAKELVTRLMLACRDGKGADDMHACFNMREVRWVPPDRNSAHYRPQQKIGNCGFRNPLEAVYDCIHRKGGDPDGFQRAVYGCARKAAKANDAYPELQVAAEHARRPPFYRAADFIR